ncbi:FGGY family carbohydrate kinase [uncultured Algoriphagus sp.]|uniref:FGGY-family carbohydrate kinase n=1 Tax=uncultured Algoriphagus sp. TaxID=417365 RepID=UPI002583B7DE|nr:FGGY family carbohydrate kinase [uncultured Algoriphagus sp.]
MNKIPVTAVFDIGKTNKKFFLFDQDFKEVYQTYTRFEPIPDDDGFQSLPIQSLRDWMISILKEALRFPEFEIKKLNFSAHGATFVHLNEKGEVVLPVYDYLKPYPEDLLDQFYSKYGGKGLITKETSSPALGMLNSGLQLYFLKHAKPEQFRRIKYSVHLPQYLCYIFTGELISDYTSIGCHTALWDFTEMDYHYWVKEEGIVSLLPPIRSNDTLLETKSEYGGIPCGIGIHDSSSALLPYIEMQKDQFVLLSTGTWAISINPFNQTALTEDELSKDCLQFMSIKGFPIKISRLFLGEEHKYQIDQMYSHWGLPLGTYKKLKFDPKQFVKVSGLNQKRLNFRYLEPEKFGIEEASKTDWSRFSDFSEAYHTLIHELTDIQVASLSLVQKESNVSKIFVDGGFNANEHFIEMLKIKLPKNEIITSNFSNGSALGAAILGNIKTKAYSSS